MKSSVLVKILVVLTFMPNVVIPIMNYQFNFAVNEQFATESGLIEFFSYFRGVLNIISLVILLFVGKLYDRFGLPVALMFHPFNYMMVFLAFLLPVRCPGGHVCPHVRQHHPHHHQHPGHRGGDRPVPGILPGHDPAFSAGYHRAYRPVSGVRTHFALRHLVPPALPLPGGHALSFSPGWSHPLSSSAAMPAFC
jgi:hypothetical protein